jgi:phosphohistidine phosphatase
MGPTLLVMRHGPAEAPGLGGDAARSLSATGRARVRQAALALADLLPSPQRIYASPLVRARETAELLAWRFGVAEIDVTPLLAPGVSFVPLVNELARTRAGLVAMIGHEPDLSGFVGWQLGLGPRARVEIGKGCACLLELARPGEAVLRALYPLETLAGE